MHLRNGRRLVRRGDRIGRLESQTPRDDARRDDGGRLERELRSQQCSSADGEAAGPAAEERGQAGGNRSDPERAREGIAAGAQIGASAEEQRLDRRNGGSEHLRDLGIAAALDLAHHDRAALVEGNPRKRGQNLVE